MLGDWKPSARCIMFYKAGCEPTPSPCCDNITQGKTFCKFKMRVQSVPSIDIYMKKARFDKEDLKTRVHNGCSPKFNLRPVLWCPYKQTSIAIEGGSLYFCMCDSHNVISVVVPSCDGSDEFFLNSNLDLVGSINQWQIVSCQPLLRDSDYVMEKSMWSYQQP